MDYVPTAEVRVIDGDTIRLGQERIRILNIDAPETENRARCNAELLLAAVATTKLAAIIMGERLESSDTAKTASAEALPTFGSAAPMWAKC